MPIYEYLCPNCKERFSVLRPIRAMDDPAKCPKCGEPRAVRQLSVVAAPAGCTPAG